MIKKATSEKTAASTATVKTKSKTKASSKKLTASKKLISKKAASAKKNTKKSVKKSTQAKQPGSGVQAVDLGFIGSKDEVAETRNVVSRIRVRSKIDSDVEAFLSLGGTINNIEANVMADPPRKPESNYGSRPI